MSERERAHPRGTVLAGAAAGAIVMAVGALLISGAMAITGAAMLAPAGWTIALGIGGVVDGALILTVSIAVGMRSDRTRLGGGILVVLALVSLIAAAGGLLVGFALALGAGLAMLLGHREEGTTGGGGGRRPPAPGPGA
ncbi:MAG: hypothetical protein QXG65_03200 [Thermoplasmata archaeon]